MTLRKLLPYSIACLLMALPILSSCVDGGMADVSLPHAEADGSGVYVSVVVNTEPGHGTTKAYDDPTPGENGDGKEEGKNDENRIYNLHIFFFEGEVRDDGERKGINSAAETPIVAYHYFSQSEITSYGEQAFTSPTEIEDLVIGKEYDVLVVANAGDKFEFSAHETLGSLRDETILAIQYNKTSKHFCMASANPVYNSEEGINSLVIEGNNSQNNPAIVSVGVERITARVDCHYKDGNKYMVGDDEVEILGAVLVNKYQHPSYVFKRVTEDVQLSSSSIIYLGEEKGNATIPASNYVIDPKTFKPSTETDLGAAYENPFSSTDWNNVTWKDLNENVTSTKEGEELTYSFLDYAQENIVSAEVATSSRATYCTGIVFRAKYTPKNVVGELPADGSFYWYDNQAFASLDKVKEYSTAVNAITDLSDENCAQYGILKYEEGICYYTYWIRHADDGDPTKISPMEYAIVRNNIYQLDVRSISGIGSVTPIEDAQVIITVYVVDWKDVPTIPVEW